MNPPLSYLVTAMIIGPFERLDPFAARPPISIESGTFEGLRISKNLVFAVPVVIVTIEQQLMQNAIVNVLYLPAHHTRLVDAAILAVAK